MIWAYRVGNVAQSVEQRTENPCVGGSIPSITTINRKNSLTFNKLRSFFVLIQFGGQFLKKFQLFFRYPP